MDFYANNSKFTRVKCAFFINLRQVGLVVEIKMTPVKFAVKFVQCLYAKINEIQYGLNPRLLRCNLKQNEEFKINHNMNENKPLYSKQIFNTRK